MDQSAYIITKPLQYINATNISDNSLKYCFLVDSFEDSNKFYHNVKLYSKCWQQVQIFKNRYAVLFYILFRKRRFNNIYTDSDFGIITRILLFALYPINIFVYEEGFGSYRKTIRTNSTWKAKLRSKIDFFFGDNYLGGCFRTKGIYLYHPHAFIKLVSKNEKKQLLIFKTNFIEHVHSLKEITCLLPHNLKQKVEGKNVLIYLSSWEIDPSIFQTMQKYPKYLKIIKPHPHIKKKVKLDDTFEIVIPNSVPAEILISEINQFAKKIVIIHQGSSALLYVMDFKNLIEYNLSKGTDRENYEKIKTVIKVHNHIF